MPTAPPQLPEPREQSGPYRVGLVCLGNICRSPMAHVVLTERLAAAGLAEDVRLRSGGTGSWHLGKPMDERAAATLHAAELDPTRHRAQQVNHKWLTDEDLVLAMDRANRADIAALAPELGERLVMFRAYDPQGGPDAEVPDPWYGGPGGFSEVLDIVQRTADCLTAALTDRLGADRPTGKPA